MMLIKDASSMFSFFCSVTSLNLAWSRNQQHKISCAKLLECAIALWQSCTCTFQFGLVFLLLFFPCDESVARLVQDVAISDTKGKHSPPHLVTKSRFVENLEYNLSFLASSLKSEFYHPDEKSLSKDPWRLTKPPCCRWIAFLQTHWALIAFWHIIFIRWNWKS